MMTEPNSENRKIGMNIVAPSIQIEHEDIETVEQYVYLSQLVHMNRTQKKELKRQKIRTWSKFGKLSKYLQDPAFPLTLKKFLQCVVPTLLYASERWATTKSMEDK